ELALALIETSRPDDAEPAQVGPQPLDVLHPAGEADVAVEAHQVQRVSRQAGAPGGPGPGPLMERQPRARRERAQPRGRGAADVELPAERRKRGVVVGAFDPGQAVAGVDTAGDHVVGDAELAVELEGPGLDGHRPGPLAGPGLAVDQAERR